MLNIKFYKISSSGVELMRVDGRTDGRTEREIDTTNLIVALRSFAKASEDGCKYHSHHI